jgi:hypothetical protein
MVEVIDCGHNDIKALRPWPNIKFIHFEGNTILNEEFETEDAEDEALRYIKNLVKLEPMRRRKFYQFASRVHENKMRNVNAEIICRPNTGVNYQEYIKCLNEFQ